MGNGDDPVAEAVASLAAQLPFDTARTAAAIIRSSSDLRAAIHRIGALPHPHYRGHVVSCLTACVLAAPDVPTSSLALALLTAARCEHVHRSEHSVELVWSGPEASQSPMRRTEQAILQVLNSARHRITLVSYAVYRIPNIRDALCRAARRGVQINVVVETPDLHEGENEYSTLRALGRDVAECCTIYYWPGDKRGVHAGGKTAILHVKCAVADRRWLFLSSANLTEYAFTINAELGVLITGGVLPAQVEAHFDRLIAQGLWRPVGRSAISQG